MTSLAALKRAPQYMSLSTPISTIRRTIRSDGTNFLAKKELSQLYNELEPSMATVAPASTVLHFGAF